MRLLHASLRQVRLHRHLELRFDPHFTLLGGANEAGKSTVVEALHKVLFLRASATGRAVAALRFHGCTSPALRDYERGYVKEGVGAGGLSLLWQLAGRDPAVLAAACDRACRIELGV